MNSYEDYAAEFVDVENPAIRVADKGKSFTEHAWQVQTGSLDGDHVKTQWQFSPQLTLIMQAAARRIIEGTEKQI